jgi:hypothetical protein
MLACRAAKMRRAPGWLTRAPRIWRARVSAGVRGSADRFMWRSSLWMPAITMARAVRPAARMLVMMRVMMRVMARMAFIGMFPSPWSRAGLGPGKLRGSERVPERRLIPD